MTSIPNTGDPKLVPTILEAAQAYEPMSEDEQAAAKSRVSDRDSPFRAPEFPLVVGRRLALPTFCVLDIPSDCDTVRAR
jgi:hypothetical protein